MYVDITLDKPRKLRFDLLAFRSLEDAMDGKPLGQIVTMLGQLSVTGLCLALWAGLRHEDRKLTQLGVQNLVGDYVERGGDLLALTKQLNDAISESQIFRSLIGDEKPVRAEGNGQPELTATE